MLLSLAARSTSTKARHRGCVIRFKVKKKLEGRNGLTNYASGDLPKIKSPGEGENPQKPGKYGKKESVKRKKSLLGERRKLRASAPRSLETI